MFSPLLECPKCGGSGFRSVAGPFYIHCRPCRGTGQQVKLRARIWWRIKYGSSQEN
jgi:DnaJ-class molecular chaperone